MRRTWTDLQIRAALFEAARAFDDRMPSAPELMRAGQGSLVNVVARRGGFREWSRRTGLALKPSCTQLGQQWELTIFDRLVAAGMRVERQTTRAPFDLLVNGRVRVNVKAATYHAYRGARGGECSGYFFGIGDTWQNCDVFCLVRVLDSGRSLPELWVPSSQAQQQTITLTPGHRLATMFEIAVLGAGAP